MASTQSGSRGRSYPVRPSVSRAGACGGLDTPPALPLYGEAARLAELVDAAGLGPAAARCGGSSPSPGTTKSQLSCLFFKSLGLHTQALVGIHEGIRRGTSHPGYGLSDVDGSPSPT